MKVPLSRPDITAAEKKKVLKVLNTPQLCLGPKLDEFEKKIADYVGSRYAVAINSGTSGLHLSIKALNIKDGDEVLTTPFSFVASANCILFERAKPVFVDIDKNTYSIDINQLEEKIKKSRGKNSRLKAILPVHVFGRPCEIAEITMLSHKYELTVIEDACEAIGAEVLIKDADCTQKKTWKKVGTFGKCSVFAFYPNKQITTGEGGMIVTDEESIYTLCRSMRNQGRSEEGKWLQHERLGYNYRISDINCALGIAQLERIDEILKKRENVARLYSERLKSFEELSIPQIEENKKISWFVYVVKLNDFYTKDNRDYTLSQLRAKGIGCNNYFSPIHLQPFYRQIFGYEIGSFPITESVSERTIALPFYNNLKESQVDYVCENLKKSIHSL